MHFAEPQRLLWLLLAIPLVLAYVVMLVRRRQQVATVALWAKALARREPWTIWRRWVSLAAALALLVMLVVTAAEPRFSGGDGRALVLVIDVSASMRARDVTPSRLAGAKAEAQGILDSLGPHDRAAILSAGSLTRVHCGLSSDHILLDRALQGVHATDGATNLREAVEIARGLLKGSKQGQILVVTDGGFDDPGLAAAKDVRWLLHRGVENGAGSAASTDNLAITRFEVRSDLLNGSQALALVETTNFGDKPETVKLHVFLGSNEQTVESLVLPPRVPVQREIALTIDKPVMVSAALETDDALIEDNLAQSGVAPRQAIEVALTGDPSNLLRDAIAANPLLQIVEQTAPVAAGEQTIPLDAVGKSQVVSVVNRPAEVMPGGSALVIAPTADAEGLWRFQGTNADDAFASEAASGDAIDIPGLRDVAFGRTVRLEFLQPKSTLLAAASGEPIVSFLPRENGNLIVLHAPIEGGDLARHPEFPLLIDELIRRLAGGRSIDESSLDTATTVAIEGPNLHKLGWFLEAPDGRRQSLGVGAEPRYVTLDATGLWERTSPVSPDGGPALAVCLLDPRESDLGLVAGVKSQPWTEPAQVRIPFWFFFAVAALVLVALEWTFHRRGTLE